MTPTAYTGPLWQDGGVHPDLWALLQRRDLLVEITTGSAPYRVIFGVPHHAAAGVDRIAKNWLNPKTGQPGRAADETTGLAALVFFEALRELGASCKLVIAAHPTDHDPNKTPGSPYWESVFSPPLPEILFELHGAAKRRRHALELSAGRNKQADPMLFGRVLTYFYNSPEVMAYQSRPGSWEGILVKGKSSTGGRLQNPALETASLTYAGDQKVPALHLEMKASFRQPVGTDSEVVRASPETWTLARAVASTIDLLYQPDSVRIAAADLGLPSTAFLTRPSLEYQDSYLSAVAETPLHEMNDNPELRIWSASSFENLVQGTRSVDYYGLPENPPEEYLWLIDKGEFIGRVFFLHWLNDFRLKTDGQVDYWIRPSRRGQGYGKLILRLLLERFRQLGLDRVLVTCLETNTPSQKIILANGGQLEGKIDTPDWAGFPRSRLRYWIDLKPGASQE